MRQELQRPSIIRSIMVAAVMTFIFAITGMITNNTHWWYWTSFTLMVISIATPTYMILIKLPGFKQIHESFIIRKEAKHNFKVKTKEDKMQSKLDKAQAQKEIERAKKEYNKQRKQIIKQYKDHLVELTPEEQDKVIDELIKEEFGG